MRPFLGGAIRPAPRYFVASHQGGRWSIDAGRVHGIPAPAPDDAAVLALFALRDRGRGPAATRRRPSAKAKVSKVLAATSQVEITEGEVDPAAAPLKAVITHLPTPRLRVKLEGDPRGVELARGSWPLRCSSASRPRARRPTSA